MTLQEIIQKLESTEFQANISSLSGFRTVLTALDSIEIVQDLVDFLADKPADQKLAIDFIKVKLSDFEAGYAHPHDISITALLYALEKVESAVSLNILETIRERKEFFWARYMAQKIISEKLHNLPQKP
jgi:hypothetical protein